MDRLPFRLFNVDVMDAYGKWRLLFATDPMPSGRSPRAAAIARARFALAGSPNHPKRSR